MATERSERELNQDINAAIAGTEDEIFRDALDGGLDDNDGDKSLEEMGEGLEGDVIDEDDIEVDEGEKPEEDDEEEPDEDDEEAEEEEEEEPEEQPRDERGKFEGKEPQIPPARLRAEAERAREAEQRVAILEARLNDVLQRVNAPPSAPKVEQQAAPKPDMFAEPEKYEQWVLDQAEQRAIAKLDARFADRDRQQQENNNRRVDESLSIAARGERSFEFTPAYNKLTSLDPKDPQARATVQRIYNSQDPAKALFEWWDENGATEYREQIAKQLGFTPQRNQRAPSREERPQPRHEIRGPKPMRSLNSASGSNSQRVSDPDMLDGSEAGVFEYATRR